jgi:hypothetical protein
MSINDIITAVIAGLLTVCMAILAVRDFINNKGANVAKVLGQIFAKAGDVKVELVVVDPAQLEMAMSGVAAGDDMSDEQYAALTAIVSKILEVNYNNPETRTISIALASTIISMATRDELKTAYTKNSDAILHLLNTFTKIPEE